MRIYVLLFACIFGFNHMVNGQQNNFWQETSEQLIPTKKTAKALQQENGEKYFKLDINKLKQTLKNAPNEYDRSAKKISVTFPLSDGTMETFLVAESPVMAPKLAARYPSIKTYIGTSIDNPLNSIRFDYTPLGFHGAIHTPEGKIYIDPFTKGKGEYCVVYNLNDLSPVPAELIPSMGCGVTSDFFEELETKKELLEQSESMLRTRSVQGPVEVIVYGLALACTGEFGARKGGTKELVNAEFAVALNRVNLIFELEVAVKMELIELNDNLIFLDGSTDPYNEPSLGSGLLGQNLPAFIGAGVFTDTYDVGHVFTNGCSDVGGVVSGAACTGGKMRGVTCFSNNNTEAVAVRVLAHEIGHQFSCGHSWDNCPVSADQRASGSSYEPGAGTTIMSYSGTCGDQNIQNNTDDYYNIGSLESFINFTRVTMANCGTPVANGNNEPEVSVPYENGFFIPASTPFELTAIGSDIDGDPITFCWEQHNIAISPSSIGIPEGDAPIFRSRRPTIDPSRSFPRLNAILGNSFNNTEVMPTYDRNMSFFCTVRDNVANGGGTVWDDVNFKVDGESGPFRLTFPSTLSDALTAGALEEIMWDPANTENAPVNCETVDIMISYDNGATFIDTLATGIKNDGSYALNIPDIASNNTRFKIKSTNSIFFDLSNNRIEIAESSEPNFTLGFTPEFQNVCAPATVSLDVKTGSVFGFEDAVEISIIGDIPDYVSNININKSSLIPGENSTIDVEIEEPGSNQTLSLTLQAVSANADTTFRTVEFEVRSNDFSSLSLDGPLDGTSGIIGVPDFVWSANTTAQSFTFELATSPTFAEETILDKAENLTEGNFELTQVLAATTLFYWRVTPFGECGAGQPSSPSAFHTASFNCQEIEANDLPISISTNFSGDVSSKINVVVDGTVSDINIINLTGNHSDFSDLSFSIVSPAGTRVNLVSNKCFALSSSFDMGFDQESPFAFNCPPNNIFLPQGDLSVFTGENTLGIWELIVNDRSAQFGGNLDSWSLEFCSSVALSSPELVRNNTLNISEDFEKVIDNSLLRVEDDINLDWELIYTLVTAPQFGQVFNQDIPLNIGDKFTQRDINNFLIAYKSNEDVGDEDNFLFTVIDGDGGWTGTHSFNVNFVDPSVSTKDLDRLEISVYPNPVREMLNVKTNSLFSNTGSMEVYNLQGQLIVSQKITGNVQENIGTSNFHDGIYFLKIQDEENTSITKFVVKK